MTQKRQRGFTMVSAIFLLVVLAALGAFIVVVSTSQQVGSAMDVQGARAYQAARAGIEWGAYNVWNSPPFPQPRNSATCPPSPTSFVPPAPTLSGFTVTVTCSKSPPDVYGGPTVFSITAIACNMPAGTCPGSAGSPGYVERRLTVTI